MNDFLIDFFNLNKKTILITGASGYLGSHIAEGFLKAGSRVILLGRSDRLKKIEKKLTNKYQRKNVICEQIDFYQKVELERCLQKIKVKYKVDVIINNAYDMGKNTGFNTPKGHFEYLDFEKWMKAAESGIYWMFLTTKIIGEEMKKRGGSIINMSSMYGLVAPDFNLYENTTFFNPATYGVQKAGVIAFTRYLASYWGEHGIRCNVVAPGAFPNQEIETENSAMNKDFFIERLKNKSILKRVGVPKDLLGIFFLLASDASSFITGQTIVIDGGWTVR